MTSNTKYIIGNWKANKTVQEAQVWCKAFFSHDFSHLSEDLRVIICPPLHLMQTLKKYCEEGSKVRVGSQTVSQYPSGTYTGETSAEMLKGLVDYVVIGHSERRALFHETDEVIGKKLEQCKTSELEPILCISQASQLPTDYTGIVAYEPPEAISTGDGRGDAYLIEDVIQFKKTLPLNSNQPFLYGGSVNEENAGDYLNSPEIDGVLCGGVSLDAERFYTLLKITI